MTAKTVKIDLTEQQFNLVQHLLETAAVNAGDRGTLTAACHVHSTLDAEWNASDEKVTNVLVVFDLETPWYASRTEVLRPVSHPGYAADLAYFTGRIDPTAYGCRIDTYAADGTVLASNTL